jgi:hypothetical protein
MKILDMAFFPDGAWFHLGGYVNSQNSRIWSLENPHTLHESPLHSQKIGVWCAMSRTRIIEPILWWAHGRWILPRLFSTICCICTHMNETMNLLREAFQNRVNLKTPLATTKSRFNADWFLFMGKAERYGLRKQSKSYEGESNDHRKTEIKIRNIAPLSYKLADMLPML